MPLYEYECGTCKERTEVIQRFSEAPMETCSSCGGPLRKLISSPAIQFKGSGFYITDYSRSQGKQSSESKGESGGGDSKATTSESAASTPAAAGSESKSGDTKSS